MKVHVMLSKDPGYENIKSFRFHLLPEIDEKSFRHQLVTPNSHEEYYVAPYEYDYFQYLELKKTVPTWMHQVISKFDHERYKSIYASLNVNQQIHVDTFNIDHVVIECVDSVFISFNKSMLIIYFNKLKPKRPFTINSIHVDSDDTKVDARIFESDELEVLEAYLYFLPKELKEECKKYLLMLQNKK